MATRKSSRRGPPAYYSALHTILSDRGQTPASNPVRVTMDRTGLPAGTYIIIEGRGIVRFPLVISEEVAVLVDDASQANAWVDAGVPCDELRDVRGGDRRISSVLAQLAGKPKFSERRQADPDPDATEEELTLDRERQLRRVAEARVAMLEAELRYAEKRVIELSDFVAGNAGDDARITVVQQPAGARLVRIRDEHCQLPDDEPTTLAERITAQPVIQTVEVPVRVEVQVPVIQYVDREVPVPIPTYLLSSYRCMRALGSLIDMEVGESPVKVASAIIGKLRSLQQTVDAMRLERATAILSAD